MLQPLQLQALSNRYPAQIAELREFFVKAGVAVEAPEALATVARRAEKDAGFRRDLSSYVWTILYRDAQVSDAALLGAIALAASGIRLAADADEQHAHTLLRFVMAARKALQAARFAELSAAAEKAATTDVQTAPASKLPSPPPRRKQAEWLVATASVFAGLLGGSFYLLHRTAPAAVYTRPASNARIPTAPDVSVARPATVPPSDAAAAPAVPTPRLSEPSAVPAERMPSIHSALPSAAQPPAAIARSETPAPSIATAVITAPFTAPLPTHSTTAPLPISRTPPGATGTTVVPAATLSRRLGARTIPSYAANDSDAAPGQPWRPRLLRRHGLPGSAEAGDELLAEVEPPDTPVRTGASRTGSAGAAVTGTVRPTAVGMMAANVVYSPVPPYPAAASAAHVQGEVRVQAQVDVDGSVASARIVSGPPLLRDAALNAVQQWRYRPYVSGGKPMRMTATAVVAFELP